MNATFPVLSAMPSLANFVDDLSSSSNARIYLVLAVLVVALFGLAVAILLAVRRSGGKTGRRHKRHRHHHRHGSEEDASQSDDGAPEESGAAVDLPRPGMRRRVSKIMNPTLAQTGGLPPRREDGAPPQNLP